MYRVLTGHYMDGPLTEDFDSELDAMDFADMLFDKGFSYAEVVDGGGSLSYFVTDNTPRDMEDRRVRETRAKEFAREYMEQKKKAGKMTVRQLQDDAYLTYAENIRYSKRIRVSLTASIGPNLLVLVRSHGP